MYCVDGVARPYLNLVRYHGIFSNRSNDRPRLPPPPSMSLQAAPGPGPLHNAPSPCETESLPPPPKRCRSSWARLLKRTIHIDALTCPRCSETMAVVALITDPAVVQKNPQSPPPARRRPSPLSGAHAVRTVRAHDARAGARSRARRRPLPFFPPSAARPSLTRLQASHQLSSQPLRSSISRALARLRPPASSRLFFHPLPGLHLPLPLCSTPSKRPHPASLRFRQL